MEKIEKEKQVFEVANEDRIKWKLIELKGALEIGFNGIRHKIDEVSRELDRIKDREQQKTA